MNKNILTIVRACEIFESITTELNKSFGWTKFSSKRKFKKALDDYNIPNLIDTLMDDRWTTEYLYQLQYTILAFKINLEKYMDSDIYISDADNTRPYDPKEFLPMYFKDTERGNMIMLEIIASNITFTIMDGNTGNSFSVSSADFVQPSQVKIATVCKARLCEMLKAYYQDCVHINPTTLKRIFSDIKSSFGGGHK